MGNRFNALDGLRGIAVLLVMATHSQNLPDFPRNPLTDWLFQHGNFGVELFFCISGFIITHILIEEERGAAGRIISLQDFYIKRALRILPPALLYLFVAYIASDAIDKKMSFGEVLYSILFLRNYFDGSALTGHFWSLAVEEHFYLVMPFFILMTRNHARIRVGVLVFILLIHPLWVRHVVLSNIGVEFNTQSTDLRLTPLAMGCFFALMFNNKKIEISEGKTTAILAFSVSCILYILSFGFFINILKGPALAFFSCCAVAAAVAGGGYFGRILTSRLLLWIVAVFCAYLSKIFIENPSFLLRNHVLRWVNANKV